MLYHIALLMQQYYSCFNVVHYVSFRAIVALLSTLIMSLLFGDWFIRHCKVWFRAKAREYTPETHRAKDDMPTMGGLFITMVTLINIFLWADLSDCRVWIFMLCMSMFGAIGCWDDWSKIKHRAGISARMKFNLQLLAAGLISVLLIFAAHTSTTITFPFFKNIQPDIGLFFIPWIMLVIIGCCNAVNLTDGLDGLAIGSLIPNFVTFSIIAYLAGNCHFSQYLHIPYAYSAQMVVVGAALVGASLGFLWFNTYPAQIFMGDVGSLALGSALAYMALVAKQELLLLIAGGLFVLETVSVIAQVISYKCWGRRLFKMAPIHHHFELMGWPESRITVRFAIISLVLCLLALITLKLR